MDVWFSGYNRDVVTTAWVGFDNYTPLGRKEFGGTAALPIWIEYMRAALKDSPQVERPMPPGIVTVKIDPQTGQLASAGQRNANFRVFQERKCAAALRVWRLRSRAIRALIPGSTRFSSAAGVDK